MEMIFEPNEKIENLKGRKPMEVCVPPETNPFGSHRNTAGIWGSTRWSAGGRPKRFLTKAQERSKTFEKVLGSGCRRKTSKGQAQERWKLKNTSQGIRANVVERVTKPCGTALLKGAAKPFRRWRQRDRKKEAGISGKC
jgi:hypothetical protein